MTLKADRIQAMLGRDGDDTVTAVMARLGREDLETLDTLIAAGIANSRAEAVRWALARIRERPAYEQIRARSREIEALKSQF
jgi:Arc/MetJ-type ribon-helix-helix transcriptional regulator